MTYAKIAKNLENIRPDLASSFRPIGCDSIDSFRKKVADGAYNKALGDFKPFAENLLKSREAIARSVEPLHAAKMYGVSALQRSITRAN